MSEAGTLSHFVSPTSPDHGFSITLFRLGKMNGRTDKNTTNENGRTDKNTTLTGSTANMNCYCAVPI